MELKLSLINIETKSESYERVSIMNSLTQPKAMGVAQSGPQLSTPEPSPEKSDHESSDHENSEDEIAEAEDPSDDESVDLDAQSPTALECVEQLEAFVCEGQGSLEEVQNTFKKAADKGTAIHLGWCPDDTRIARQLILGPLDITKSNPSNPQRRVRPVHVPSYREMKFDAPTQLPSPDSGKLQDTGNAPIEGKALLLGRVKTHYRVTHENHEGDFEESYIMAVLPDECKRLVVLREEGARPIHGNENEVVYQVDWDRLRGMQKFPGWRLCFGETEFTSWNTL